MFSSYYYIITPTEFYVENYFDTEKGYLQNKQQYYYVYELPIQIEHEP